MKDEKLDFDENNPIDLLKEAYLYFNMIPRTKRGGKNTRDSYELASKIGRFLKKEI